MYGGLWIKMEPQTTAVTAHGLTKKFGDFTAVNNIDFQVRRGEIFGFLGPNGSGKTTTIRMLLGLLQPTSGTTGKNTARTKSWSGMRSETSGSTTVR